MTYEYEGKTEKEAIEKAAVTGLLGAGKGKKKKDDTKK